MGVDFYACDNCGHICNDCYGNYSNCECCGNRICYYCLEKTSGLEIHTTGDKPFANLDKLTVEDKYGEQLIKQEYCPICRKAEIDAKDPEYEEYLRLKKKFGED